MIGIGAIRAKPLNIDRIVGVYTEKFADNVNLDEVKVQTIEPIERGKNVADTNIFHIGSISNDETKTTLFGVKYLPDTSRIVTLEINHKHYPVDGEWSKLPPSLAAAKLVIGNVDDEKVYQVQDDIKVPADANQHLLQQPEDKVENQVYQVQDDIKVPADANQHLLQQPEDNVENQVYQVQDDIEALVDANQPLLHNSQNEKSYGSVSENSSKDKVHIVSVGASKEGFCRRNLPVIGAGVVGAVLGAVLGAVVTWLLAKGGHNVSNNVAPATDNSSALTATAELFASVISPNASNPAQIMQNNGFDLHDGKVNAVLDNYNLTLIYINGIEKQEYVDTNQIVYNMATFISGISNKHACDGVGGSVSEDTCDSFQVIAALAKGKDKIDEDWLDLFFKGRLV